MTFIVTMHIFCAIYTKKQQKKGRDNRPFFLIFRYVLCFRSPDPFNMIGRKLRCKETYNYHQDQTDQNAGYESVNSPGIL